MILPTSLAYITRVKRVILTEILVLVGGASLLVPPVPASTRIFAGLSRVQEHSSLACPRAFLRGHGELVRAACLYHGPQHPRLQSGPQPHTQNTIAASRINTVFHFRFLG